MSLERDGLRGKRFCRERGAGLLSSVFGLGVVMVMVGLACAVAVGLWDRSAVESIAYEAALDVATADPDADSDAVRRTALEDACVRLGNRCTDVRMTFVDSPIDPMVELHVVARARNMLPRLVADRAPVVGDLDRTIRIHKERP